MKTLEKTDFENQICFIKSLLRPYEERAWGQSNWVLTRFWLGNGFSFRDARPPSVWQGGRQRSPMGLIRSRGKNGLHTGLLHHIAPACPSEYFHVSFSLWIWTEMFYEFFSRFCRNTASHQNCFNKGRWSVFGVHELGFDAIELGLFGIYSICAGGMICSVSTFRLTKFSFSFPSIPDSKNRSRTSDRDRTPPIESMFDVLRIDRIVNAITGNDCNDRTGDIQRLNSSSEQRIINDSRMSNHQSATVSGYRSTRQFPICHRLVSSRSVGCDSFFNYHRRIGNLISVAQWRIDARRWDDACATDIENRIDRWKFSNCQFGICFGHHTNANTTVRQNTTREFRSKDKGQHWSAYEWIETGNVGEERFWCADYQIQFEWLWVRWVEGGKICCAAIFICCHFVIVWFLDMTHVTETEIQSVQTMIDLLLKRQSIMSHVTVPSEDSICPICYAKGLWRISVVEFDEQISKFYNLIAAVSCVFYPCKHQSCRYVVHVNPTQHFLNLLLNWIFLLNSCIMVLVTYLLTDLWNLIFILFKIRQQLHSTTSYEQYILFLLQNIDQPCEGFSWRYNLWN